MGFIEQFALNLTLDKGTSLDFVVQGENSIFIHGVYLNQENQQTTTVLNHWHGANTIANGNLTRTKEIVNEELVVPPSTPTKQLTLKPSTNSPVTPRSAKPTVQNPHTASNKRKPENSSNLQSDDSDLLSDTLGSTTSSEGNSEDAGIIYIYV